MKSESVTRSQKAQLQGEREREREREKRRHNSFETKIKCYETEKMTILEIKMLSWSCEKFTKIPQFREKDFSIKLKIYFKNNFKQFLQITFLVGLQVLKI